MGLIRARQLSIGFGAADAAPPVVDGVDFAVSVGEITALVGESGSGKSLTALALIGLLPDGARIQAGRIDFDGTDLTKLPESRLTALRGSDIAMVFQEPMASLNPMMTAGQHIMEPLRLHQPLSRVQARKEAIALLARVGIPSPEQRIDEYPHRMSGGMRQRVMIAAALAGRPRLLIADEPTTALDVTIQAQILDLLSSLRDEFGMAVLLITHDLGLVEERADNVLVMYAGRIIEHLPAEALREAAHPYTRALLACIPGDDRSVRLANIPGGVPSFDAMPEGCRFSPRCSLAAPPCLAAIPPMLSINAGHEAACVRIGR